MSLLATAWAWESDLPSISKLVLMVLADCHEEEYGSCTSSVQLISKMAGIDPEEATHQLVYLEECGMVSDVNIRNFKQGGVNCKLNIGCHVAGSSS